MQRPSASPQYSSNELDLREFVQTLWASKLWIILTTLIATCIAAAYAFGTQPTYEATVNTLPPTASGLATYNAGSQLTGNAISGILSSAATAGIKEISTEEAYSAFLLRLTSDTVRQRFFERYYLPGYGGKASDTTEQRLWNRLSNELTIKTPSKPDEHVAKLTLLGKDPKTITSWANKYVNIAIDVTREDLLGDLAGDVQVRKKGVTDQINTLREVAHITRKERIIRLENALTVAESIGLETPPPGSPLITIGSSITNAFNDGNMMYLRGAKALRSELALLKERKNDDAYIPELTDLLKKQALLNNIDLNPERLSVAIIDRAAIVPEDPVKPKKALILALGIILGGILGIFLVILRRAFT